MVISAGTPMVVKRALLSCYDKTGLDAFAKRLAALGIELVASGGTAEFLRKQGLRVQSVETFAGITEQLDGRVKTLHPKIHAGILARRDHPDHVRAVGEQGLIDLVVVNLYPFEETVQRPGASLSEAIEQIDIGGVALLRAAAKNFAHVTVVSDPSDYPAVAEALEHGGGALLDDERRRLAAGAFRLTAGYDRMVERFLTADQAEAGARLVEWLSVEAKQARPLRYGENPHQQAAWYAPRAGLSELVELFAQLQGKPLSYNNLLDLDATLGCLGDLEALRQPACVIVKHASPCGAAVARAPLEAYRRAFAGDPESAFGGIVGINGPIDGPLARTITETFLEVIVAKEVQPEAREMFAKKPNLRVIGLRGYPASSLVWRSALGGWLVQEADEERTVPVGSRVVTKRQPSTEQWSDLRMAWIVAKHVRSNAIVLAKEGATVGIGQGQPSRVRAVRLAVHNALERGRGAVLASDGFFPFPDNVDVAAAAGVGAIIQPGGSVKDAEVIAAADRAGLAMVLTGVRHFRH